MEEMLNVLLFITFSLPLIFPLVAGGISRSFSHRRYKIFLFFFQRNRSSLFFISRSSCFSVIESMQKLKLSRKKELALLIYFLFFVSKSPGGYAIYSRNGRVFEMQNFTPVYMKGWTYVRDVYGRLSQNQNFLDA